MPTLPSLCVFGKPDFKSKSRILEIYINVVLFCRDFVKFQKWLAQRWNLVATGQRSSAKGMPVLKIETGSASRIIDKFDILRSYHFIT